MTMDVLRHAEPYGPILVQMNHLVFEGIPILSIYSVGEKAGAATACLSQGGSNYAVQRVLYHLEPLQLETSSCRRTRRLP